MPSKALRGVLGRIIVASWSFVFAFGSSPSLLRASGGPPAESISGDQTIVRAVVAYPRPPTKFRPLSASDAELEGYGFPPRPDPLRAPRPYAHWKKLVSVPRVANAVLRQTTIYHGPVQNLLIGKALRNGMLSATSLNWSGYAVGGASGTFASNNSLISAEWVVPRAQQGFGVCDGSWDYSSQWIGFDGLGSNEVLQAGTEADAYCSGSTQAESYYSWIEWAPAPSIFVSIPPARPGDLMVSSVWYTTTPPFGHAYLINYTLYQAQAYAFNPPPSTTFAGNSAEWIEERPTLSNGLANLANYLADQFNFSYASNSGNYFTPGASPAGTTTYALSMTCPPWTPGSSCPSTTVISTPYLYGGVTSWFYDSGPALY